jgi:predicted GNAT family N-acyltransferase
MNRSNPARVAAPLHGLAEQPRVCCIDLGAWSELTRDAYQLRHAVFVLEQKIQLTEITDQADETALHVLARDRQQRAIGTGRLVPVSASVGKVEFLAVSEDARGQGVGRVLLATLIAGAREHGMASVMLFAQQNAVQFYLNAQFMTRGPVFEAVGRPHQEMVLIF